MFYFLDKIQETNKNNEDDAKTPFVTSLNSDNGDDFLIIPLKYLEKQLLSTNNIQEEVVNDSPAQEADVEFEETMNGILYIKVFWHGRLFSLKQFGFAQSKLSNRPSSIVKIKL